MDHTYIKPKGSSERLQGFQVIQESWRHAPDHSYAMQPATCNHQKRRGQKKGVSTPIRSIPSQPAKFVELEESIRNNKWSMQEKEFLQEFSQSLRGKGESENEFWRRCATIMNSKFGEKNRTGCSCKSAARRLNLTKSFNFSKSITEKVLLPDVQ